MKSLFLHLPNETYQVVTETEDTFDREVQHLEGLLVSTGSCWIPVHTYGFNVCETHIFLTESMKKRVYLRTSIF
jgi:hypothetical protein